MSALYLPELEAAFRPNPSTSTWVDVDGVDAELGTLSLGSGARMGRVLEVGFVDDAALSVLERDAVLAQGEAVFNAMEAGETAQFVTMALEGDIEEELAAYQGVVDTSGDEVAAMFVEAQVEHMRAAVRRRGFGHTNLVPRRIRSWVVLQRPVTALDLKAFGGFLVRSLTGSVDWREIGQKLASIGREVRSPTDSGLSWRQLLTNRGLAAERLHRQLSRVWNAYASVPVEVVERGAGDLLRAIRGVVADPARRDRLPAYDEAQPFGPQAGVGQITVEHDRIWIDDRVFQVLALRKVPSKVPAGVSRDFLGLPGEWSLSFNCRIPPRQEVERKRSMREWLSSIVVKLGARDAASYANEIEGVEMRASTVGKGFVMGAVYLTLWAESDRELDTRVAEAKGKFAGWGFEFVEVPFTDGPETLRRALPGGFDPPLEDKYLQGAFTMEVPQAVSLLTLLKATAHLDPRADHLSVSEAGELGSWSTTKSTTAGHFLVQGTTGGGKGVATTEYLMEEMRCGATHTGRAARPSIAILDIRQTYRHFCHVAGGAYQTVTLESDGGICFSPFWRGAVTPDGSPIPRELTFQTGIFLSMISRGRGSFENWEEGLVEELIWRTHDRFKDLAHGPTLSDVLRTIDDPRLDDVYRREGSRAQDFAERARLAVRPYTVHGAYGQLFDGPPRADFESDVVVFDLDAIKDNDAVMGIVAVSILYGLDERVLRAFTAGRRSILILDECWAALKHEVMQRIIEERCRAGRHRDETIGIVTQGPDELLTGAGPVVLAQTQTKIFLPIGTPTLRAHQGTLDLSDEEVAQIASLRQEKGVYSQYYVKRGDVGGKYFFPAPPMTIWLSATEGPDLKMWDRALETTGGDHAKALAWLCEHHPHGAPREAKKSLSVAKEAA